MKLLVLTSSWPRFDGDYAGHFVREWVEAVGFPATVLVPAPAPVPAPASVPASVPHPPACPPGIEVIRVPYSRSPRLFYGFGALPNVRDDPTALLQLPAFLAAFLAAAVDAARLADVVVSHWLFPAGIAGAIAARITRRPHIAIAHGSDRVILERLGPAGRAIVARAVQVPMGVAPSVATPLGPSFSRVVFVGRRVREKGLDTLALAAARLPWLHLSIVGDGPFGIPRGASDLGTVPTDRVASILAAHDGFVLPSRAEGAPRSLLEAMMAARPIVATTAGRIPEIARHRREALLVPPDSPTALADALSELREDRALRERLARAAHARASLFAWPRIAAAYRAIIADAANRRSPRGRRKTSSQAFEVDLAGSCRPPSPP